MVLFPILIEKQDIKIYGELKHNTFQIRIVKYLKFSYFKNVT